jgi:hypothetical protein
LAGAQRFSYPHLFTSVTVQQPVSMQASYRLWHTRCVPQCARACEQVARSWADAWFWDMATNGTPSAATRAVPNSKRAITSPHKMAARLKSYIRKQATAEFKSGLEMALPARTHGQQTSRCDF